MKKIKNYPTSIMINLERQCGFDIAPYLSKDIDCSNDLTFKEHIELTEKYFKKTYNFLEFKIKSEKTDFGEELSLYHQFVNGLMLIEILHTTWLKLANVIGVTKQLFMNYCYYQNLFTILSQIDSIHPGYFAELFRFHDSPIKTSINEFINDPTKSGISDWWIQSILRKWWDIS